MDKKILIVIIVILSLTVVGEGIFLFKKTNEKPNETKECDSTEEIRKYKEYMDILNDKLRQFGVDIFNSENWIDHVHEGEQYSLNLASFEENNDISDFINYYTKEPCDKNLTRIEITMLNIDGKTEIIYTPALVC